MQVRYCHLISHALRLPAGQCADPSGRATTAHCPKEGLTPELGEVLEEFSASGSAKISARSLLPTGPPQKTDPHMSPYGDIWSILVSQAEYCLTQWDLCMHVPIACGTEYSAPHVFPSEKSPIGAKMSPRGAKMAPRGAQMAPEGAR